MVGILSTVLRRCGQKLRQWAHRSSGRFVLHALVLAAVLTGAAAAGAVVVPRTAPTAAGQSADGTATTPGNQESANPATPIENGAPATPDPSPDQLAPGATGRPADALSGWAIEVSAKVAVPTTALEAYGYAELVTATTQPACKLSWTTLAGIGKIESDHGRARATLSPDGKSLPPIIGAPLDGLGGRDRIADTDAGRLDNDPTWDHAVGPMQFIPATWQLYAIDADRDGVADPNDLDDATLAAARYLCAGGRDLSVPSGWWAAIESYNAVRVYTEDVFRAANDYGQRSR